MFWGETATSDNPATYSADDALLNLSNVAIKGKDGDVARVYAETELGKHLITTLRAGNGGYEQFACSIGFTGDVNFVVEGNGQVYLVGNIQGFDDDDMDLDGEDWDDEIGGGSDEESSAMDSDSLESDPRVRELTEEEALGESSSESAPAGLPLQISLKRPGKQDAVSTPGKKQKTDEKQAPSTPGGQAGKKQDQKHPAASQTPAKKPEQKGVATPKPDQKGAGTPKPAAPTPKGAAPTPKGAAPTPKGAATPKHDQGKKEQKQGKPEKKEKHGGADGKPEKKEAEKKGVASSITCEQCKKPFQSPVGLKQHMDSKHKEKK